MVVLIVASHRAAHAARAASDAPRRSARDGSRSAHPQPSAYEARVILLAIDGASLDFISPAAADGRLPNFGRLLDAGATLHLATLAADAARARAGGHGHREAPVAQRRALRRHVHGGEWRGGRNRSASGLLLRARSRVRGSARRIDADCRLAARAAALEHPRTGRTRLDDRALAADVSRAAAAGVARHRPVPSCVRDRACAR